MNRLHNETLTPNQVAFTILGAMVGAGIVSLPNNLVKISQQDAWITAALGGIYPFYIALITIYISKKHPNYNLLYLSKKYFGNLLGSLLNLLFLIEFIIHTTGTAVGFANISRVYSTPFLSELKLIIFIIALTLYSAYKGVKLIGKISEIIFYITLILAIIPILSFGKGSLLNLSPILGSGLSNILKGSVETTYSYGGIEILFLIYPYINDKRKIKNASLKGVFLTILLYSWITFITIYYFALNVTSKSLWPFLSASEIIDIPLINNFRFFFMILWSIILLKTIAIECFIIITILKDFMKKIDMKKICLIVYPVLVFLSLLYPNEIIRRDFLGKVIPITAVFPVIYATLIALLIRIKG